MKYNNKLNLAEYIQVVNEIAQEYFDINTYEYTPHIGEMYAICSYFNHCVTLEDFDSIKIQPIEGISDMETLYNDEDFMIHYNEEIDSETASLTFGRAYKMAIDIVNYKKNDVNAFANAISLGIGAILQSFKESFKEEDVNKIAEIAQQITSGKLSDEGIVKAYENSDRFKENTEKLNDNKPEVIAFPIKK